MAEVGAKVEFRQSQDSHWLPAVVIDPAADVSRAGMFIPVLGEDEAHLSVRLPDGRDADRLAVAKWVDGVHEHRVWRPTPAARKAAEHAEAATEAPKAPLKKE